MVRNELKVMSEAFDQSYRKFAPALDLMDHFEALSLRELSDKLKILIELDENEPRSFGFNITISVSDLNGVPKVDVGPSAAKMRIANSTEYVEFAKLSLADLRVFQNTGDYNTNYELSKNRDFDSLHKYEDSDISKTKNEVWLGGIKDPEKIISTTKPYIEGKRCADRVIDQIQSLKGLELLGSAQDFPGNAPNGPQKASIKTSEYDYRYVVFGTN